MSDYTGQSFGIYPRVSTQEQARDDKASLDAQVDACRYYGEREGMCLDPACVMKEAYTSTTTERPQLTLLLAEMRRRNVRNLVIDRADRLTRQGMLAAAVLLSRFTDAGITLHIASRNIVVRDEAAILQYMIECWGAQQANTDRTRAISQTRKRYAKHEGRPYSGNHAPYGFVKVVDKRNDKGNPTHFHYAADLSERGGYRAWEVRRDVCRWYLAGMSGWKIAQKLTEMGVPTSRARTTTWAPTTIYEMLADPINEGTVTTYRTQVRDGKQVRLDRDQHISIPGLVTPGAVILTPDEAERIHRKLAQGKQLSPRRAKGPLPLLSGGLSRCGLARLDAPGEVCGWALRVKHPGHGTAVYYACSRHGIYPTQCGGQSIPAWRLDQIVWNETQGKLMRSEELERLAEQQAKLDSGEGDDPASERSRYEDIRAEQVRKRANYLAGIGEANNADARAGLLALVDRANELIHGAEKELARLENVRDDTAHRRAVLGNVYRQRVRHLQKVLDLAADRPDDLPYIRTILRSLGVRAIVRKTGEPGATAEQLMAVKPWEDDPPPWIEVTVEFNLGTATGEPWFGEGVVESESRREYVAGLVEPSEDGGGVLESGSR